MADNVKKETAKLILAEYRERVDNDMTEFMHMLNELGIVGESEIMDTIKNFNNALIIAVNEDSTATTEALIKLNTKQLGLTRSKESIFEQLELTYIVID